MTEPIMVQVPVLWESTQYVRRLHQNELNSHDIRKLTDAGFERAYYQYGEGSYEWAWTMIALKDGLWYLIDLSHCSCYWPCDSCKSWNTYDSIDQALQLSKFSEQEKDWILKDWK